MFKLLRVCGRIQRPEHHGNRCAHTCARARTCLFWCLLTRSAQVNQPQRIAFVRPAIHKHTHTIRPREYAHMQTYMYMHGRMHAHAAYVHASQRTPMGGHVPCAFIHHPCTRTNDHVAGLCLLRLPRPTTPERPARSARPQHMIGRAKYAYYTYFAQHSSKAYALRGPTTPTTSMTSVRAGT